MSFHFTSESVTEGHPDKVCDQISDSILDAVLEIDSNAHVAIESLVKSNNVVVAGELTYKEKNSLDIKKIIRNTLSKIGYNDPQWGFPSDSVNITEIITKQSSDINEGVSKENEMLQGAGDQGIMFGYACNHTKEHMPMPIYLAHELTKRLAFVRKNGLIEEIGPDGKSQVTIDFDEDGNPVTISTIVISTHHNNSITQSDLHKKIISQVIDPVVAECHIPFNGKTFINPAGQFLIGGPIADSGVTGRKIIVDTYGGWARHGGGAFSGKDPSKVDRSAAYAARWIAKSLVASNICKMCEIQLSYAIGIAEPTSIFIDTFGTSKLSNAEIIEIIKNNFNLTPYEIIKQLNLKQPIYEKTASYGHFGQPMFSWEKIKPLLV